MRSNHIVSGHHSFDGRVIFHCVDLPQFVYPSIGWCTFGLFLIITNGRWDPATHSLCDVNKAFSISGFGGSVSKMMEVEQMAQASQVSCRPTPRGYPDSCSPTKGRPGEWVKAGCLASAQWPAHFLPSLPHAELRGGLLHAQYSAALASGQLSPAGSDLPAQEAACKCVKTLWIVC